MIYGPEFGFVQVDSERRKQDAEKVIKRSYRLGYDLADDTLTQVLVAEFIKRTESDRTQGVDLDTQPERPIDVDACAKFVSERRANSQESALSPVLIGARQLYEAYFEKDLPRNVAGWDDFLTDVACANLQRPQHEIAVAVWAASRRQAALEGTMSTVASPQIHFDHTGLGRQFMPAARMSENEPFVEIAEPFVGVVGVNDAWMYLDPEKVDTYSSEVVSYLKSDWEEAYVEIARDDEPIEGRPLGFHALPFSAEGFARNMTLDESGEFIFEQMHELINANQNDQGFDGKYIAEVMETGVLGRPAIIEKVGFTQNAGELMKAAYESYKGRRTVFDAWDQLLERAQSLGLAVRELGTDFENIETEFGKRFSSKPFTIREARESLTLMRVNRPVAEIVDHLTEIQNRDASIERAQRELERPALPTLPRPPQRSAEHDRGDDLDGGRSLER